MVVGHVTNKHRDITSKKKKRIRRDTQRHYRSILSFLNQLARSVQMRKLHSQIRLLTCPVENHFPVGDNRISLRSNGGRCTAILSTLPFFQIVHQNSDMRFVNVILINHTRRVITVRHAIVGVHVQRSQHY